MYRPATSQWYIQCTIMPNCNNSNSTEVVYNRIEIQLFLASPTQLQRTGSLGSQLLYRKVWRLCFFFNIMCNLLINLDSIASNSVYNATPLFGQLRQLLAKVARWKSAEPQVAGTLQPTKVAQGKNGVLCLKELPIGLLLKDSSFHFN